MAESDPLPGRRWPVLAGVAVVGIAIVLALTGGLSLLIGGGPTPSAPPAPAVTLMPNGFPPEVSGMPVVAVGDALALIETGAVDGRALAVGGWWLYSGVPMGCPFWPGFIPPLVGYCEYQGFASAGYRTWTCDATGGPDGCGTGRRPPGVAEMQLGILPETASADQASVAANANVESIGVRAVIIGHTADPRLWHCLGPDNTCRRKFVVDRVAWIDGATVELFAQTLGGIHGMVGAEAMALGQGHGDAIAAVALRSGELATIDPRFHGVGTASVWVIRSLRSGERANPNDPTRAVDVALVDDGTVSVVATVGLEMDSDYQPGILLVQATETGASADDEIYPYYRIETPAGVGIQEMRIGAGSWDSGQPVQRYGAGLPAVLDPGDYVVRAWRAQAGRDAPIGPARDECTTTVSVAALGEMRLQAEFPATGPCTFVTPTFETVFDS